MNDQIKLKERLLKLRDRLATYACHGIGERYRVASGCYNGWNRRDENGVAWVERLDSAGLRFVGYADEIIRLDHTGWFTNAFQDETYRGVVLQLPGRDGCAQYLAAYADPHNKGSYRVDASEIYTGDRLDSSWQEDDGKREAARAADGLAECEAEKEREYQDAWQLGNEWSDCTETIHNARRELAALRREVRKARILPGIHTAKALLARCAQLRANSREAYERRESIIAENFFSGATRDAFNEAAGREVIA